MKKVLLSSLFALLIGAAPLAHALDIKVTSNDTVVTKDKFATLVNDNLPADIKSLGPDYRLSAVLETQSFRDKLSFYFYSVMLMRKVVEQGTGKVYWVQTGGLRSNGLTEGGDKLTNRVHDDMVAGSKSFRLDQ
jgi:hypothetical protein